MISLLCKQFGSNDKNESSKEIVASTEHSFTNVHSKSRRDEPLIKLDYTTDVEAWVSFK